MLIIMVVCLILAVLGIGKVLSYRNRNKNNDSQEQQQLTFQEKKALSQKRAQKASSSINGYQTTAQQYPESYLTKLNSQTLLPLDTIEDHTGRYYLLMGTLWPAADFPYTVIETRFGFSAVVPLDLKQYVEEQKAMLATLSPDHPDNYSGEIEYSDLEK